MTGVVCTIALGDYIVHSRFTAEFLRDEMAELDAKLTGDGDGDESDSEDDIASMAGAGSSVRFWLVWMVLTVLHLTVGNAIPGGFLGRYSHPGVALTNLRNDDPSLRRVGIDLLINRLDFTITPAVERAVLGALDDPDEGVVARATFVAGVLDLEAAVEAIGRLAVERPSLTFTALISLGQLETPASRELAKRLAKEPVILQEPQALALMLGLLKVPLNDQLVSIYKAHPETEDTRVAAIWAMGEMRDPRLLKITSSALQDPSLAVRCAASHALEKMVVTESSAPLRAAFVAGDPYDMCPEKNLPVQEGGPIIHLVKYRSYMFGLIRALATTDDPLLLRWLVDHQEDTPDHRTRTFMERVWERLRDKDSRGELNKIKQRLLQKKLREEAMRRSATPDGGVSDGGR